jgi:antitoxin Phd
MRSNFWQLQDAKSKFSQLVEQTLTQGVQIVTRRGKKTVVVMSFTEYERLTRNSGKLSSFLMQSPLAGVDLDLKRNDDQPRPVEIET